MPDREHAAVEAVEPARFDAPFYTGGRESCHEQLLVSNDTVLSRGDPRDAGVDWQGRVRG
jgi:hypothetical protein